METYTTFGASGYPIDSLHLLRGAASESAAGLLAPCPVLRLASGETVAPDQGACLYVVLRGALEISQADARAGDSATRVLPGECVGELAVLDDATDTDRIRALQESDLLAIDATTLWKLIDESNGVARNLLRLLSFRVRAANAQSRRRQKVGEFYRQLSMADGLTGLQNRAWLNQHLPALIENAQRVRAPLSVIMIDIDHFKHFNDAHGHLHGDQALLAAAHAISKALRPSDFAARFGGEELLVILPQTPVDGAVLVAQRLRERLRQSVVLADMRKPLPHITASFGVAALNLEQDAEGLLAAADAALYRAKEAGRDCVAV